MSEDEKAIRELVATWISATKEGDSSTVLGLMADDALFLVPGQAPFGKSAFAETAKAQTDSAMQFDGESEVLEIKVLDDLAYMLTRLKVTATQPGGQTVVRAGHTLTILRKENGKWRLARDANLLVPVEATGR